MPRRSPTTDLAALSDLIARDDAVLLHRELRELGFQMSTVGFRCRPGGPWRRLLPGVVLASNGSPTQRQIVRAAVKYAGPQALVTGLPALTAFGSRRRPEPGVHLLVPHQRQASSCEFVVVERTHRLPVAVLKQGLPYAPVERAAIDAARRLTDQAQVRALLAEAVQRLHCTPHQLARELAAAQRRGTALARRALIELGLGIRSAAEADARSALLLAGVREPEWNVELFTADGEFIACVDAWYDDVAVVFEVDSMEFHFDEESYKSTQRRQAKLARFGVIVVPVAPGDIRRNPPAFARLVADTLRTHEGRPRPPLVARPSRSLVLP